MGNLCEIVGRAMACCLIYYCTPLCDNQTLIFMLKTFEEIKSILLYDEVTAQNADPDNSLVSEDSPLPQMTKRLDLFSGSIKKESDVFEQRGASPLNISKASTENSFTEQRGVSPVEQTSASNEEKENSLGVENPDPERGNSPLITSTTEELDLKISEQGDSIATPASDIIGKTTSQISFDAKESGSGSKRKKSGLSFAEIILDGSDTSSSNKNTVSQSNTIGFIELDFKHSKEELITHSIESGEEDITDKDDRLIDSDDSDDHLHLTQSFLNHRGTLAITGRQLDDHRANLPLITGRQVDDGYETKSVASTDKTDSYPCIRIYCNGKPLMNSQRNIQDVKIVVDFKCSQGNN